MSQTTINNGDTGAVSRAAINGNFTELYGSLFDPASPGPIGGVTPGNGYFGIVQSSTGVIVGSASDGAFATYGGSGVLRMLKHDGTDALTVSAMQFSALQIVILVGGTAVNNAIYSDGSHLYWRDNGGTDHQLDN